MSAIEEKEDTRSLDVEDVEVVEQLDSDGVEVEPDDGKVIYKLRKPLLNPKASDPSEISLRSDVYVKDYMVREQHPRSEGSYDYSFHLDLCRVLSGVTFGVLDRLHPEDLDNVCFLVKAILYGNSSRFQEDDDGNILPDLEGITIEGGKAKVKILKDPQGDMKDYRFPDFVELSPAYAKQICKVDAIGGGLVSRDCATIHVLCDIPLDKVVHLHMSDFWAIIMTMAYIQKKL